MEKNDLPANLAQFESFTATFSHYGHTFFSNSTRDDTLLQLKIDHTMRVCDHARLIVKREIACQETGDAILLAALFHDIGRFEQYHTYKTFNDRESINHARLGIKILKEKGILSCLDRNTRTLIYSGVVLHNLKDLPSGINQKVTTVCKAVRDSDKLDIFKVMLESFSKKESDPTICLGVKDHPTHYTTSFYSNVVQRKSCLYSEMRWINDFKLMLASWVHDLNFQTSYQILHDSGNLTKLFMLLPPIKPFILLKENLEQVVKNNLSTA